MLSNIGAYSIVYFARVNIHTAQSLAHVQSSVKNACGYTKVFTKNEYNKALCSQLMQVKNYT